MNVSGRLAVALALALMNAACASAKPKEEAKPTSSASYFVGTMSVSSPDGKIPYGPPKKSVVIRTLTPSTGTIVEEVAQDGMVNITTLTRRGQTSVFDTTDTARSFSGTVTFQADPFAMTSWAYAIAMADGSRDQRGGLVVRRGDQDAEALLGAGWDPEGADRRRAPALHRSRGGDGARWAGASQEVTDSARRTRAERAITRGR
ncbi:MAG: hypothetical protein QM765_50745 [Myxococcales bacterium]